MGHSAGGRQVLQNITRASHVLPICYQQPFTKEDGELFVQFFHRKKPPISLHPLAVGVVNDFYTQTVDGVDDDRIEKFFGRFVEGDYAAVAKRITELKHEFILEPHEVPVLLRFVATQIVRTQAHRECIDQQAGISVPQEVFIHNMHRKMKLIADRWLKHTPDVLLWTPLPHLRTQFITGDNPVVSFSHADNESIVQSFMPPTPRIIDLSVTLESPHNGFIVPLSPYVCLTVINSGERDSIRLRPAQCTDPLVIRDFNRMIYNQCVTFVAAQDPEHIQFHVKRK
jgi:Protein of unknown function (DUF4238)